MIVIKWLYYEINIYFTSPKKSAGNWFYCKWIALDFNAVGYRFFGFCFLFINTKKIRARM
jgi:hypothetical protein